MVTTVEDIVLSQVESALRLRADQKAHLLSYIESKQFRLDHARFGDYIVTMLIDFYSWR